MAVVIQVGFYLTNLDEAIKYKKEKKDMNKESNDILDLENIEGIFNNAIEDSKFGDRVKNYFVLEQAVSALDMLNGHPEAQNLLHQTLGRIYTLHISNGNKSDVSSQFSPAVVYIQRHLERIWESENQRKIDPQLENTDFSLIQDFRRWYKDLLRNHPATHHPIFEYLENEASIEEMSYFFSQEITVDSRFDDLLAMLQVGQDLGIKMEIAENYWDEMGNGNLKNVHTELFDTLLKELHLTDNSSLDALFKEVAPESLACGNLLIYSAIHRDKFNIGLGAMGAVEMLAPIRFNYLVKGFERLGLSQEACEYHKLHITIDTKHGNGWINNAIVPLVERQPELKKEIAYGALLRLESSLDYLNMIYNKFQSDELKAEPSNNNDQENTGISSDFSPEMN